MSNAPLMPMATAVWLVENTSLTLNKSQIFAPHEVEVQGIADGEVAKELKLITQLYQDNFREE